MAGCGKDGNFRRGVVLQGLTPRWEFLNVARQELSRIMRHLMLGRDSSAVKYVVNRGIRLSGMSIAYRLVQPIGIGDPR